MTDDLLRSLAAEPGRAAVLLDVDGTLAPIVDRPGDARVPDEARHELARLAGRYALVACVSGRPGREVERAWSRRFSRSGEQAAEILGQLRDRPAARARGSVAIGA